MVDVGVDTTEEGGITLEFSVGFETSLSIGRPGSELGCGRHIEHNNIIERKYCMLYVYSTYIQISYNTISMLCSNTVHVIFT